MPEAKIKVVIADDHPLAIEGLQNMLRTSSRIQISGAYENGTALLEGLPSNQPDILLLDVLLPDWKGAELAGVIGKAYPEIKIIALTSLDTPIHVRSMIKQGCKGYILKNTDSESLIDAIEEVFNGGEYIEPVLKERMLQNVLHYRYTTAGKSPNLTQREKEILKLIVEECTSQQIADKLYLSLRTVETHRFNLQKKLGVNNNVALVKIVIQMGLID